MAIFEVDDLDARVARLDELGVRVVQRIDLDDIRARHLHPRDVGGAIVSIDEPRRTARGAGRTVAAHTESSVVTAIAGIDVAADNPDAMGARWPSSASTTPCATCPPAIAARASTPSTSSPPTGAAPVRSWRSAA